MKVDETLMNILRCPMCGGIPDPDQDPEGAERLICKSCHRWFPVHQGIPFMLPDHDKNLGGEELNHQFRNEPGITQKKARRWGWYYGAPKNIGGVEEGSWIDFDYREISGAFLDIGAGDRHVRENLLHATQYVSIDVIPRDRPTVVADAHFLPFGDGSFDVVIARALIEHVENPDRVISEVSRVLKPGGVFGFSAPFIYPIHDAVDYHRFTIYKIRSFARHHDFEIMRLTSSGGYFGILAQHVYQGLKMVRDYIDVRYRKKPMTRRMLRFFSDLTGMVIYLPFYLLRSLDGPYRRLSKQEQGRIPFVKGYGAVFRKK